LSADGSATIQTLGVSTEGQTGSFALQIDQIKVTPAGTSAQGLTGSVTPNVGSVAGTMAATGQAGSFTSKISSNVAPIGVNAVGVANFLPQQRLLVGTSAQGRCNSQKVIVSRPLSGQVAIGAAGSLFKALVPITGRAGVGAVGNLTLSQLMGMILSGNVAHAYVGTINATTVEQRRMALAAYVMIY